eukprot:snap_masked-scaffold_3-processed-gene-11.7-mRNA-1 protein AED:0.29 eAED:1.00 QI:0/-1/0/1/-1/1/1/0/96
MKLITPLPETNLPRFEKQTLKRFGEGKPIPEEIVRSFVQHRSISHGKTRSLSDGCNIPEEETPTIDALNLVQKKFMSLVSLEFLIGNLDNLQEEEK